MDIILYHGEATRSARILWLLGELGLPFRAVRMTLGEVIASPELRNLAPLPRVPFVAIDGVPMMESLAIMQWLAETADPAGSLWVRPGEPGRFDFLQWLQFAETMAVHVQVLNQQKNVIQPPEARSAVTIKLETRRLEKTLAVVEARLGGRDFLCDRGFTIADIAMAYSVHAAGMFTPLEPFARLQAYLGRLRQRPAAVDALSGSLMAG